MNPTEILGGIVLSIVSGILSYLAATSKANKDLTQLREQNKLDIEKLMNQHKMDLEAVAQKHQMDIEKMELEHKHKIELTQKEMEGKLGSDLMSQMVSGMMKTPEVQRELLKGMRKKK
jgi:lantibiotic modifying enzyme